MLVELLMVNMKDMDIDLILTKNEDILEDLGMEKNKV